MRTASTWKPAERALFLAGLVLVGFLHFFALSKVPGLHFDEAWAYNYAAGLIGRPLTFEAMSPYTAPWAHYWAALWISLFGPSIFVFRASQGALALGGLLLVALSLKDRGYRAASAQLFFVAAVIPGLVLNHRFAIELNGLHVFCLGLGLWALRKRIPELAALAFLVGATGHILFYTAGLALVGAAIWEGRAFSRRERLAAIVAFLLLAAFFGRVAGLVPEKGKAFALFLSAAGVAAALSLKAERWRLWRWHGWEALALLGGAVFAFNALFFSEGSWSLALSTGMEGWKSYGALGMALYFPLAAWLAWRGQRALPRYFRRAIFVGLFALGLMMLKPAPRYFELALVAFSVVMSLGLATLRVPVRALVMSLLLVHALPVYVHYFATMPREKDFHFLFFKDSSRDFLSKQALASVLGGLGCAPSAIETDDPRVKTALDGIARGDWPVASAQCPWPAVRLERRAESVRAGADGEAADFLYWGQEAPVRSMR